MTSPLSKIGDDVADLSDDGGGNRLERWRRWFFCLAENTQTLFLFTSKKKKFVFVRLFYNTKRNKKREILKTGWRGKLWGGNFLGKVT